MTIKDYAPTSSIGQRLTEVQRIKLEIDKLTEALDKEKAALLGHAIRNGYDGLSCGALTVSRRERISWVYSDSLQEAEAKIKQRKIKEQKSGIAIGKSSEHLVINFSAKTILAQITV